MMFIVGESWTSRLDGRDQTTPKPPVATDRSWPRAARKRPAQSLLLAAASMTRSPGLNLLASLCFLAASGCTSQKVLQSTASTSEAAPSWIRTNDGPSKVRLSGWGEVVLSNGLVLGVGRAQNEASLLGFLYHPDSNRWTKTPSVSGVDALGEHLSTLPDGQALAFGVDRAERHTLALKFDSARSEWRVAGMLPELGVGTFSRKVASLADGRSLVLDGRDARTAWVYDEKTEAWSQTAPIPRVTSEVVLATSLGDGRVFVIFGDMTPVQGWIGMVYDAAGDRWLECRPGSTTMRGEPDGVLRLPDGSILLLGFQQYPTIEFAPIIFRPDVMKWESAGHLPGGDFLEARSPTLLPNRKVLALQHGVAAGTMRAIVFDPARRAWRVDGDLPDGYSGAVILGARKDGSVWAIGFRSNVLRDELVRGPFDGVWRNAGALPRGAVAWGPSGDPEGDVLLYTGPNDRGNSAIDGAHLFRP